ncbi:CREG1.2 family protein [Megaselia abdita]
MHRLLVFAFLLAVAYSHPTTVDFNQSKNFTKIARTLVHKSSWAAFGTISSEADLTGYPMVNVISIADDEQGKILFMLMDLDYTGKDWRKNNNVTLLFSDDQNRNCKEPMNHECPRVHISGHVEKMAKDNNDTYKKALDIFLTRHPEMTIVVDSNGMGDHGFYLCKLNINKIVVQPYRNGNVSVDSYYGPLH